MTGEYCPLCGTAGEQIFHLPDLPVFYGLLDAPSETKRLPFTLLSCPACSFVFQEKDENVAAHLNELYSKARTFLSAPLGSGRQGMERLAWWLETFGMERPGKVMEIGCATGKLLENLSSRGFDCTGVDPSPLGGIDCATPAVEFINRQFPCEEVRNRKFDYIVANLILEHVADIDAFMRAVTDCLADNGKFIVSVPDNEERLYRGYPAYSHEHFSYFTSRTLSVLLWKYGFGGIKLMRQPDAIYALASANRTGERPTQGEKRYLRAKVFDECVSGASDFAKANHGNGRIILFGACGAVSNLLNLLPEEIMVGIVVADSDPMKSGKLFPGFTEPVRLDTAIHPEEIGGVILVPWGYQEKMERRARGLWGGVPIFRLCQNVVGE